MSPKCLYAHAKGPTKKEYTDQELKEKIKTLQDAFGHSLGYRKLSDRLEDDYEIKLSRKTVLRLAREAKALSSVRRRHFSEEYYLTRKQMKENAPPDLIKRDFFALKSFIRFVCDITYLTGSDETWYLSVIEDLFVGEIVAWKIGEHCTASLCVETVIMMKEVVGNVSETILHSDGGSTYTSYAYRELLLSYGINQSMGMKLTCYDNARVESFNAVFKTEALYAYFGKTKVKERRVPVKELAARAEWFIPYYNKERKKDSLGKMTPVQYREINPMGTYPVIITE